MARRPLPIGSWGRIKVTQLGPKSFEARARFRRADGSYARPRRVATGREAAKEELIKHMLTLLDEVRDGQISADSRMEHVANLWVEDLELRAEAGTITPGTAARYKGWVFKWVLPRIKELTARELEKSVMTCEKAIKHAEAKTSKSTAGRVKVAFGLLCAFAVRHGAMGTNPVRATDKVGSDEKKVLSLQLRQRRELLAKLDGFAETKQVDSRGRKLGHRGRVWRDLPDRFRVKFATGVRVGEVVALTGDSVDTQQRLVYIDHHLVFTEGVGVVRVPGRKANRPNLVLKYPDWAADTFRRLKLRSGGGPLFPNSDGQWINPSAASTQESDALAACGFEWVTGHVIRKTVAMFLRSKGVSIEKIAAQLGDSEAVVKKYYLDEEVANEEQAEVLEGLFDDDEEAG